MSLVADLGIDSRKQKKGKKIKKMSINDPVIVIGNTGGITLGTL
jgi:hypothetical protein